MINTSLNVLNNQSMRLQNAVFIKKKKKKTNYKQYSYTHKTLIGSIGLIVTALLFCYNT